MRRIRTLTLAPTSQPIGSSNRRRSGWVLDDFQADSRMIFTGVETSSNIITSDVPAGGYVAELSFSNQFRGLLPELFAPLLGL